MIGAAKTLLLSHLILTSLEEFLYNRDSLAANFTTKYRIFKQEVAPYINVPCPQLFEKADEIILLWFALKTFVAMLALKR